MMGSYTGELLKLKREEAGLTLDQISSILEVNRQAVNHVEVGRMKLPFTWILPLCEIFQMKPAHFVSTLTIDYENSLIKELKSSASK